eukprot:evm.model.scf_937.1 EVM.evm.TU.scf_937.1   scf_937:15017-16327(-)
MAATRTKAGQAAERLKAAIASHLNKDPANWEKNKAFLKAIGSCDRFLWDRASTQAEFERLKDEVKATLLQRSGGKVRALKGHAEAPRRGRVSTGTDADGGASPQRSCSTGHVDWTLPPLVLERKAFAMADDFGRMTTLQDEWAKMDDGERWAKGRQTQEKISRDLDGQMEEVEARRRELREQKCAEAQELSESMAALLKDQMEAAEEKRRKQNAALAMFTQQVEEKRERKRIEKAKEMKENMITRARLQAEIEAEKVSKAQQAEENRAMLRKAQ